MSQRLEMFDKLIAKGSQDPFVFYARAMELRNLGRGPEALDAFRALRESNPSYVPQYLMAGQLATELGDSALARELLEHGQRQAQLAGDSHAHAELTSALAALP
ncbi:MAG: tetratricopeptide repeat protein [Polyangiales bacterium]